MRYGGHPRRLALTLILLAAPPAGLIPAGAQEPGASEKARDLTSLSLSELAALEVTSVSKRPEARFRTPAAIHLITDEDIRHSGARSVPEALRFAPGVHVAAVDANKLAIGIRGFTSRLTRSQLVLVDGRSAYTPLFAGTYWEVQDTLLEDLDRVEVVRGPGGTLWGANAVNGIINVITKSARATPGVLATLALGNEERRGAARWGSRLGSGLSYRVYAKYFDHDAAFARLGEEFDGWHIGQGGFRADWERGEEQVTVQGDLYRGRAGQRTSFAAYDPPYTRTVDREADLGGGNLLARWRRSLAGGSTLQAQAYYDRTRREEAHFNEVRDTIDFDLQHRTRVGSRQEVVWGLGYRTSSGRTAGVETVVFTPPQRRDDLLSAFVQDEVQLRPDRLTLTLGAKLEHNDYSGFELQPSVRALWSPHGRHVLWAAVSRAVRTPSRVEHDLSLTASASRDRPVFFRIVGTRAFEPERLQAYEAGYRVQAGERLLVDVAAFHNRYPNLLSLELGSPFAEGGRQILPFGMANQLVGRASGGEVAADLKLRQGWAVHAGYSYLHLDLTPRPGSTGTSQAGAEGASPRHQGYLRSTNALFPWLDLDVLLRLVDELPSQDVPGYAEVNARLAWRPRPFLELAAIGRNLLRPHHLEFGGSTATEVERSLQAQLTWRW